MRIDQVGLSQRHCVLIRTDGLLIVRDLVTTNGTKVNGQRVKWTALMPRDLLSLGGYFYCFRHNRSLFFNRGMILRER